MQAMERYREIKQQLTEARIAASEAAKEAFGNEVRNIFEQYPKLERFSWTQYTPYFNDGEPCTFMAHTEEINFVYDGEDLEWVSKWGLKNNSDFRDPYPEEFISPATEVLNFLRIFEEEVLLDMFGDHTLVTVSRNGDGVTVETDHYDHD